MTADVSGLVFDLYAVGVFVVAAGLYLAYRAWRAHRRRPWWRGP